MLSVLEAILLVRERSFTGHISSILHLFGTRANYERRLDASIEMLHGRATGGGP